MRFKYYLQKLLGRWLDKPAIREGKTVGYSLVRSERANCHLGMHTRVYPPFSLQDVRLGDYSYIAKNASISHCEIGKFCSVGPNFCCGLGLHPTDGISTSPMFYSTARQNGISLCKESIYEEMKHTVIGNDVFIGANVTVLDGVHISDGAVIGAGAVVVDDIPPYGIAVGVPAKVVKFRFDDETVGRLLAKKWWDGSPEELEAVAGSFWDVRAFVNKEESIVP